MGVWRGYPNLQKPKVFCNIDQKHSFSTILLLILVFQHAQNVQKPKVFDGFGSRRSSCSDEQKGKMAQSIIDYAQHHTVFCVARLFFCFEMCFDTYEPIRREPIRQRSEPIRRTSEPIRRIRAYSARRIGSKFYFYFWYAIRAYSADDPSLFGGCHLSLFGGGAIQAYSAEPSRFSWNLHGFEHVLQRIKLLVDQMSEEIGEHPSVLGMGTPGAIDPPTGILKNSNSQAINKMPFKTELEISSLYSAATRCWVGAMSSRIETGCQALSKMALIHWGGYAKRGSASTRRRVDAPTRPAAQVVQRPG